MNELSHVVYIGKIRELPAIQLNAHTRLISVQTLVAGFNRETKHVMGACVGGEGANLMT